MSNKNKTSRKVNVSTHSKSDKSNKSAKVENTNWSNFQRLVLNDICTNTKILETGCIGDVNMHDVELALKHPKQGWRILLRASEALMFVSPYYLRMNNMYSNMPVFRWWLDLYDVKDNAKVENMKKSYSALAAKLESMNLKHEFSKIMKTLPYQDIYCGLVFENQSDFFIQQIDYRICELCRIQDGLYDFRIDLTKINDTNFSAYPDYVQQARIDLRDGNINPNIDGIWYIPPADKQVCFKLNSQWTFPYPILISLVKDILDLDIYKKLKLQSARTDNYKAVAVEVPIDESTVDKPLLTPDTLGIFAEMNRESMTDDIGLLHTLGSSATPISFKDSSNTRNNVSDAIESLYDSSGISKELGNGSSSGTALTFSIENDAGYIYNLYRQFERWINRFIKVRKYNKSAYKFSFYLIDATIYNIDTVSKRYREAVSLGVTCIDRYLATLDMRPSSTLGSFVTHHEIFKFNENFIPLQTSYNSSVDGSSESGRPTNKSKNETLDEAGEKTEELESNDKR